MKKSKLDQFAATLLEMRDEGKDLAVMVAWLKDNGVTAGRSTVGDFVLQLERKRSQDRLLDSITTGANQAREVENRFKENPAPEMDVIIKLFRVAILNLRTDGKPEALKLADQLAHTVMDFISGQTKAKLESQKLGLQERRVKLMEEKSKAFDAAKEVMASTLSAEEQRQRLKEILK